MSSKSFSVSVVVLVLVFVSSSVLAVTHDYPQLLTKEQLLSNLNLLGGVYCAYPSSLSPNPSSLTSAPAGYTPFYISHYGRHGSRYQPSDKRYTDTRDRLRAAHAKGVLTPLGESLLKRVEILCDSCVGHGGMLTALGARQQEAIARRMYRNFPEVFQNGGHISARASIVPRCGQSMNAFIKGLKEEDSINHKPFARLCRLPAARTINHKPLTINSETSKAYMSYIAYDTPQMRQLSSKTAPWQAGYKDFMRKNVDPTPFLKRIFTDAAGIDTLNTVGEIYWLVVGMQNLDMQFNLDDIFTPEELLACWQCVNYRMYICNGNSPISDNIPAESASTLLKNIVETADTTHQVATLRFGHDSNLLRLLALMRIHNSANKDSLSRAWQIWQECLLSPMAANLQLIFYHNKSNNILVKILLNEHEVLLDVPSLKPVNGCYYNWTDLRQFFLSHIKDSTTQTEFKEPVQ